MSRIKLKVMKRINLFTWDEDILLIDASECPLLLELKEGGRHRCVAILHRWNLDKRALVWNLRKI